MTLNTENREIGRKRLIQVFRFLEALNQKRNPVVRRIREQPFSVWFRDLPEHPSIRRGRANAGDEDTPPASGSNSGNGEVEIVDDFILKVRRPHLRRAPEPPLKLAEWLNPGWENPHKELSLVEAKDERDARGEPVTVRFADDPERKALLDGWRKLRDEWAVKERPAREAYKVFDRLYELYGQMDREAERLELVLGDGILNWRRAEGGIHHPVLLQRLQLEFDHTAPEFIIREDERPVELYTVLFRAMQDVDGRLVGKSREELEEGDFHPFDGAETSGFLKAFAQRLAVGGEFVGEAVLQGETEHPRIARDPVIFLRTRTLGFATAIEAILKELSGGGRVARLSIEHSGVRDFAPGGAKRGYGQSQRGR